MTLGPAEAFFKWVHSKIAQKSSYLMVGLNGSSPWVYPSPASNNFTEETRFNHSLIINLNPGFNFLQVCHFWQCRRINQVSFPLLNPLWYLLNNLFVQNTLYFIKMLSLLNLWSQIMVTFLGYLFLFQSSQAVGIIWHCKDPPDNLSM